MRISDWSSDVCSSDLNGEQEIGHRTGHHDGRAGAQPLVVEGFLAVGLAHGGNGRAIGAGCRVGIAEELHEAADRNGADLPAGAILVVQAEQFRAATERNNLDRSAAQTYELQFTTSTS